MSAKKNIIYDSDTVCLLHTTFDTSIYLDDGLVNCIIYVWYHTMTIVRDKEFYAVNKQWLVGNNQTSLIIFGTLHNMTMYIYIFLKIIKLFWFMDWVTSKYECRSELSFV